MEKRTVNPNNVLAKEGEETRSLWRMYYYKMTVWSVRLAHGNGRGAPPQEPHVGEPEDIDEFLDVLLSNYQVATAVNLAALSAFKHNPRASLHMLGTRFNLIALTLEENNLATSRSLAMSLLQHLSDMIESKVEKRMENQDTLRLKREEPL